MEAQVWPLAASSATGRMMLAEAYAVHADRLSPWRRWTGGGGYTERSYQQWNQMGIYAERSLDLMPEKAPRERFWRFAGMAYAHAEVFRGARLTPQRGVEMLGHWLPTVHKPEDRAWIQGRMAEYLVLDGRAEQGVRLAEAAYQAVRCMEHPHDQEPRRQDLILLLLQTGGFRRALSLLSETAGNSPHRRAHIWLERAAAYLGLERTAEAHDCLLCAQKDIAAHNMTHLRAWMNELALKC